MVNGTTMTWQSGDQFAPNWANGVITLLGTPYYVASVTSPTSMILTQSTGLNATVTYFAPTQTDTADPSSVLLAKAQYAYNRWGATLFYVDSNGTSQGPIPAVNFETVLAAMPGISFFPEQQNTRYYSTMRPYDELRGGVTGTPQSVLNVYPNALHR